MVIKIHLCLNRAIKTGVNTKINSKYLHINENGLHHPLTGNVKNKYLSLFITPSTSSCNTMASIYVSVLLVLPIFRKMLLSHPAVKGS